MISRKVCVALAVALTAACGGPQGYEQQPSALISDGAHAGRVGFYFLPPLVSPPHAAGTFDPSFAPRVQIRDLATDAFVAAFDAGAIAVDPVAEQYAVNWHSGAAPLDPSHTYRIEVWLYRVVVGFADVDVVDSGRQLKDVATGEYVPLLDGRTLPIKFRLYRGVIDDLIPRVTIDLQPYVDGVTAGSGTASFAAVGSFGDLSFACAVNGASVPCVGGTPVAWSGLADGSTLEVRVTATSNDTGITGPTAVATATVDAVAPTVFDVSIVPNIGNVIGPVALLTFISSDTPDTATFSCSIDGNLYPCAPGVPFVVMEPDGTHQLAISAFDPVGNRTVYDQLVDVDATGPVFDPNDMIVPANSACPASTTATAIRFGAPDRSPPVIYMCSLDGAAFRNCSDVAPVEGAFRWTDLANGQHTLTVIAYDFFRNPSMPLVVDFLVDRRPPAVDVQVMGVSAPPYVVTPGGTTVGSFGEIHVAIAEQTPYGIPNHLPIELGGCEISSDGPDADRLPGDGPHQGCACIDASASGDGTFWICRFAGLADANNLHQVVVTARDSCGAVNEGMGASAPWIVDSTADRIQLLDLVAIAGNVVDHGGAVGPNGDIVRSAYARFDVLDDVVDAFDSSLAPLLCRWKLDGTDAMPCGGSPQADTFAITELVSEGPHTLSIRFADAVGNASPEAQFTFYVDRSAPVVTMGNVFNAVGDEGPCIGRPGCEGCLTAGGLAVTDQDGRVEFTAAEPPASVPDYVTFTCALAQVAAGSATLFAEEACTFANGVLQAGGSCSGNCIPTNPPWNGSGYRYGGLASGTYELTVRAVDGVGNAMTPVSKRFTVDEDAPVLTYVSPPAPRARSGFAGIVPVLPGVDTVGTFQSDVDASVAVGGAPGTPQVEYSCTIDGAATTCGAPVGTGPLDLTYVISGLYAEGSHIAHASAIDCVGNVNPGVDMPFQLDRDPPAEVAPPMVVQSMPPEDGKVTFTFSVVDAITNVESITCSVDGILDPACKPSLRATALTPYVGPALTPDPIGVDGSAAAPLATRQYAGSASIAGLSAGEHVLEYTATDVFGHTRAGTPTTFLVTHGENAGWVTLVGSDFEEVVEGGGFEPPMTDAIGSILGNAALRGRGDEFNELYDVERKLRVLRLNSVSTTAASKNNSSLAICQQFGQVHGTGCACLIDPFNNANQPVSGTTSANNDCIQTTDFNVSAWAGAAALRSAMRGHDVILISDLNDPSLADELGHDAKWLDALRRPLTGEAVVPDTGLRVSGGIVIALDGLTAAGATSDTWKALGVGASSLVAPITGSSQAPPKIAGLPVAERECLDATFDDLAAGPEGPIASYWAPANTVRFDLAAGNLQAAILFSSPSADGLYKPTILTRQYRSWSPSGPCTTQAHP